MVITMKKSFLSKVMVAVALAVTTLAFTACGDDDDEPTVEPKWSTSYVVSFNLGEDVLKTADITAHIARPDGTFAEERVTKTNPSWTLTGNKIPDKAGVLLTFVPKKNIVETDAYEIKIGGSISATSFKDGGAVDSNKYGVNGSMTVKGDRLAEYYTGKGIAFAFGINDQGKVVSVKTDDFDFGLNGLWEWVASLLKDE